VHRRQCVIEKCVIEICWAFLLLIKLLIKYISTIFAEILSIPAIFSKISS
jgi:hypothetical protein